MRKEDKTINNALLNMISPMGFRLYKSKLTIGENMAKVYGITRFNENLDYGWLESLMNIPGTIAELSYEPLPEADSMDVINNNLKVLTRKKNETTDPLQEKKLQIAIDNSDQMLEDLCRKEESVGALSATVMTVATEEYMEKADSRLKGEVKKGKHRFRLLSDMQKEGYQHMSPSYIKNKDISSMLDRPAPLRTVLGGFPFASSGFNDGSGYLFGSLKSGNNSAGSNMILDPWKRGQDRNNSHMVIMGHPGVGKSTKVKDIITMEYARGTRLLVIDPEREYKTLCKRLGGTWINAGGGAGKINPLQIRVLPGDPDEDGRYREERGLPDLAAYLMHLKSWFEMACPGITIAQLNEMETILIKTYERFGMQWSTDFTRLKNEDYPIMSDVYEEIEKELEKTLGTGTQREEDLLALKGFISNMVTGSLQFLWNGHTTIDLHSNMVVIDTHDLQNNAPDYIKGAQYYNILTWMWIEASKDRRERTMIVADEAYLMIDRKIPQALVFLRNGLKRGRKYEISFVLVSHSVVDFLDDSVKIYGQAILDSAAIKILMGCDGQNLKDTVELYNLTEAEEETLELMQKGLALMIIGHMHMKVMFEVADYKWDYFGSAGGR
ncbi:MAG: ATP-binding protein [Bacteroidales bacterium]|nr:ATP-binding protein [Clostridium sp.]MCM1203636.1 ATP-binding protein [Bacteroidales bacterium]